jgi:hypothetical protein
MRPRRSFERPQQGSLGERRERLLLAGKRRNGLSIPDIQHENPRGVGKGRLLTQTRRW